MAGTSAKREKSRIMAVRRAIFVLPGHADEARAALAEAAPNRVLILATSENMVQKIAKILRLPPAGHVIHIEDIASERDIREAAYHRLKEGKHIIPVPTIELKPHFSGYLIDPLQTFFRRSAAKSRRKIGEKSIVRPVFSYYGKLIIDDSVIKTIVKRFVGEREFISKVGHIKVSHHTEGDEDMGIEVSLEVVLQYGKHIPTLIHQTQSLVKEEIERITGMVVREVNIMVRTLYVVAT